MAADLLMFTFAKSTTIDDALRARLETGISAVRGGSIAVNLRSNSSRHPELIQAGATFRKDTLLNNGTLHHKLMVLNGTVSVIRNTQVAQHFRAEVDRVFQHLSANFQ